MGAMELKGQLISPNTSFFFGELCLIKMSFAMTISQKSCCRSYTSPVFTHSQLYVAIFRASSAANGMTILLSENGIFFHIVSLIDISVSKNDAEGDTSSPSPPGSDITFLLLIMDCLKST